LAVATLALLVLAGCNKDNRAAKDLDGTWQLTSLNYAGKDTIPAGSVDDPNSFWTFAKCKVTKTNCGGHQTGFLDGTEQEGFTWFFSNKGASFDIGGGTLDGENSMDQLAGSWDVDTQDDETFIISSGGCPNCLIFGRTTLTFTKVD